MSSLPISVLKFGSSVLRGQRDLGSAVHEIYRELRQARRVVAIVSALGGTTDRLIDSARRIHAAPDEAALALLASTGETQAAALLATALERAGLPAQAFDAHRAGLRTRGSLFDADPCGLDVRAIESALDRGYVVVLPGFVGCDEIGRITLLGRGGSDLSALFVAHRLRARSCRLLKDVDGVYDRDPSTAGSRARRFETLSFADARAIGGRVVQAKALCFAEEHSVAFDVSNVGSRTGTRIGRAPSALVVPSPTRRPLRIGLLGLGTVGLGVYCELARQPDRFDVRKILVRRSTLRGRAGVPSRLLTTDPDAVIGAGCDVIVEVLGGVPTASALIDAAFDNGIGVVTANKAAVALHGERWHAVADKRALHFSYSAAVGGAVPMLEVVRHLALERRIASFEGVLNATTNFVLDSIAEGLDLDAAVARARELGYCEANPRTDLDGTDAAHKLELLARKAFGARPAVRWIERTGIDELPPLLVRVARAGGRHVRLVATCRRTEDGVEASLAPRLLDAEHPLASVHGESNALVVTFEDGASIVLAGKGAGRWPTTESVIGDLLELARREHSIERQRDEAPITAAS